MNRDVERAREKYSQIKKGECHPKKDVREFIVKLEKEREAVRIEEEIDWNLEAGDKTLKTKLIEVNPKDCTGCRLCEMECSFHHEQECSTARSRIKIIKDEEYGNHLVLLCMQCAEPDCIESCPTEALWKDEETGIVLVDEELCNGCEACLEACTLNALSFDRERNIVFKCDLCGGDPECVKVCVRGTLTVAEVDPASPARETFKEETSRLLLQMQGAGKSGS